MVSFLSLRARKRFAKCTTLCRVLVDCATQLKVLRFPTNRKHSVSCVASHGLGGSLHLDCPSLSEGESFIYHPQHICSPYFVCHYMYMLFVERPIRRRLGSSMLVFSSLCICVQPRFTISWSRAEHEKAGLLFCSIVVAVACQRGRGSTFKFLLRAQRAHVFNMVGNSSAFAITA